MAYTLNTSHPLYPNLVELIGVQGGALVSHKTARTFTKHAEASYGTGTYGEHFNSLAGGYTAKGAAFSPAISLNTSTFPNYTTVTVLNASGAVQGGTVSTFLARTAGGDTIRSAGKTDTGNAYGYRVTGASIGTGARMLTYCRIGETAAKLYNNTTKDVDTTGLGSDYFSVDARVDYLCGWDGQNSITSSLVWQALFDRELTSAEITDLYSSLAAGNVFGLVVTSGGSTNGSGTGSTDSIDLIAPTGTGAGTTSGGGTNSSGTGPVSAISLTALAGSGTGTAVGSGTLTTPALRNNMGTILASISGWTVNIWNPSTGAFVAQLTGLTTNSSGILSISSTSIVAGTTYVYEPVHATYGRRLPTGVAT